MVMRMSLDRVWSELPIINVVYEALQQLSKGEKLVLDEDLKSYIDLNYGLKLSNRELSKILMKMEVLGIIQVSSSGKENLLIKLIKKKQ
jgi:hypothetical protein